MRGRFCAIAACVLVMAGGSLVACGSSSTTLSTTLTADQSKVKAGETVSFTATVKNMGPASAQDVTVLVDLPGQFRYAATTSITGDGSRTQPVDPVVNSPSPEWGLWSIGAPQTTGGTTSYSSVSIKFTVTSGGAPGTYSTTARSSGANATGDASPPTVQIQLQAAAQLSLQVTAQPTSAHAGDTVTYKLIVSNVGSGNADTLEALATLPPGFIYSKTLSITGNSARTTTLNPSSNSQLPFWGDFTVPARSDGGPGSLVLTFNALITRGTAKANYPISVQLTDIAGDTVKVNSVVPVTVS